MSVKSAPEEYPRPSVRFVLQISPSGKTRTIHVAVLSRQTICGLTRRDGSTWKIARDADELSCGNCLGIVDALCEAFTDE